MFFQKCEQNLFVTGRIRQPADTVFSTGELRQNFFSGTGLKGLAGHFAWYQRIARTVEKGNRQFGVPQGIHGGPLVQTETGKQPGENIEARGDRSSFDFARKHPRLN